MQATGAVTSWKITQGSLPYYLTLSETTGEIFGTVPDDAIEHNARGVKEYKFEVTASNISGASASKSFTIIVYEPVTIITETIPHAKVGEEYSAIIEATGTSYERSTGFAWVFVPAFPSWLHCNISDDGYKCVLSGTPTSEGTYEFTVDCGSIYSAYQKVFTLVVDPKTEPVTPPVITGTLSNGIVGKSYSKTLTVSGGTAPYTWTKSSGTMPTGLKIGKTTGKISGKPTTAGTYKFKIKVTDANGATATNSYTVKITAPTISGTLTDGVVGKSYSKTLKATGGTSPYTWTKSSGTLPTGLKVGKTTGKISGKPTEAGTYKFKIKVTDANGITATKSYTVTITAPKISGTLSAGVVGKSYSKTLKASGGTAPYTWTKSSGTMPTGLKIGKTTGKISGKPTKAGTYKFKIKVTDANGITATKSYTVKITEASSSSAANTDSKEALNAPENVNELSYDEEATTNQEYALTPTETEETPEASVYYVTGLDVASEDVISQGTERDEDLVIVRANQPVRFVIGIWPDEVSDEKVYIDDEPAEEITISEGTFSIPAELVYDDFKVSVKAKAGDYELETQELYISAE